eukprot:7123537-Pyramimonas_sp.AAC.1
MSAFFGAHDVSMLDGDRLSVTGMPDDDNTQGVDVETATKLSIPVMNIPSDGTANAPSCAEHILYLILAMLRDQEGMVKSIQEHKLGEPAGRMLMGSNVLIVGFGALAKELVPRLKPFRVHIAASRNTSWDDH